MVVAWCEVDSCPSSICNGPHVEHVCHEGAIVTTRYDNGPCPFCGHTTGEEVSQP